MLLTISSNSSSCCWDRLLYFTCSHRSCITTPTTTYINTTLYISNIISTQLSSRSHMLVITATTAVAHLASYTVNFKACTDRKILWKLKFQWIFVDVVEWKSDIIEMLTIYCMTYCTLHSINKYSLNFLTVYMYSTFVKARSEGLAELLLNTVTVPDPVWPEAGLFSIQIRILDVGSL